MCIISETIIGGIEVGYQNIDLTDGQSEDFEKLSYPVMGRNFRERVVVIKLILQKIHSRYRLTKLPSHSLKLINL